MKFNIKSATLLDVLEKMHRISTKGIKSEYEMAGRVTIEVSKDKATFKATNGHLFASLEITKETDPTIAGSEDGEATVDVSVLKGVARAMSADVMSFALDNGSLVVTDSSSKKKKKAKIETSDKHHDFKIKKNPKGFQYTCPTTIFYDAIQSMGKYVSNLTHKVKYHMICLHFLEDQVRFVCGNGLRFGVLSYNVDEDLPKPDVQGDNKLFLIPADQASIIASVISDAQKMTITYESETSCFIQPFNGMELHLKGIPNESYIPYEVHAFGNQDRIEATVDVSCVDFIESMSLINSVRDKSIETEGNFHSATFFAADGKDFECNVDEGRYQCESSCPAKYNKIRSLTKFKSMYAAQFLMDVADACIGKDIIRFHCIDEYGTILAEIMSETGSNNPSLRFFFASALEENGEAAEETESEESEETEVVNA